MNYKLTSPRLTSPYLLCVCAGGVVLLPSAVFRGRGDVRVVDWGLHYRIQLRVCVYRTRLCLIGS
jgi:hypothetical protein